MTETERWVNETCERIVSSGRVRLYRDLYKDLRERLPCEAACGVIAEGLRLSRTRYLPEGGPSVWKTMCGRARAIAALVRLSRWAKLRAVGLTACRDGWIVRDE